MRLSHTQKELYKVSPRAWFIKYVLKYKESVMGSPLFFGSIVEEGCNALLNGKTLEQAHKVFEKKFQKYDINGKKECLKSSSKVRYFKSDFQENAHTEEELKVLEGKSDKHRAWASRLNSGKMMIKEFHDNILPNIRKVISMQEFISVPNGHGDTIIGYSDLVCEWIDGRILVLDIKTSGTPYAKDAVLTMEKGSQTALYYSALKEKYNLDGAGFLVLEKKIRKRIPQTRSQIIIDVPPDHIIEETFDDFDEVLYSIRQAQFPCCSPDCNRFGQICAYSKFCESGGVDTTGLFRSSDEKNKDEVESLRKTLFDRQKELQIEEAATKLAEKLDRVAYTVITDNSKKGRHFLIVKIKFDIDSLESVIEEVREFEDKAAGLAFVMNNDNLKFLFNKNKRREK